MSTAPVSKTGFRFLDAVERIGNKLPDPVTLFFLGAVLVLLSSSIAAAVGWSREHPATHEMVTAKSLLTRDGVQWIWLNMVRHFTGFAPLGIVLTAMLGIGVAEKSGLIAACLKGMVQITPRNLLTPGVIFVGVNSSIATDAGYVVLPPLAALVFAKAGRSPLVGLAAVIAGVGGGFSANLLLTGLDPLLQGFTETGVQLLDSERHVRADCNYYFMVASTFVITLVGWGISPELTQAAYRVGDSCVNPIAPMNPYVVVMLVFMQRFVPKAGLGSLIALLLPYSMIFLIVWTALLLAWVGLDLPLGPGDEPLFIDAVGGS